MKNIAALAMLIGGLITVALGIMLFVLSQPFGGITGLLVGLSLVGFSMSKKKAVKKGNEISEFLQNIDAVANLQSPASAIVKIETGLESMKFGIYLNGKMIGAVESGEQYQFNLQKAKNLLQIGGVEGGPFNFSYVDGDCFFEVMQNQNELEFEIKIVKLEGHPFYVIRMV